MAHLEQTQRVAGTDLYIGVEQEHGYLLVNLPCLGGQDVSRHTDRMTLALADGCLYIVGWWEPLDIETSDALAGWGHLSGPAYHINGADVPASVIEHLVKYHGLSRPSVGVD